MLLNNKIWQTLPKVNEDFVKEFPGYSRAVLQLLWNRGFKEEKDIKEFLDADYESGTHDPFLFENMEKAVELIIKNIKAENKICVYGDYDADGVTASAVMHETLKTLRGRADIYIPDRSREGYGLNKKALDLINKAGAKLIITVDGGIRGKKEASYAKEIGLEIIITDHHLAPEDKDDLPDCLIINPIIDGEQYPFKYLAGVGVSFKLSSALIRKSTLAEEQKEKLIEKFLDLTAVGTIADCVVLQGENRILVKKGLEILNKRKRMGLKTLIMAAGLDLNKDLDAWNIGFQVAPRLNAAGRMEHANTAFELLVTGDKEEAETIARRLNSRNTERQELTGDILSQAEDQINEEDEMIIGVSSKVSKDTEWNEGIIGLVAGRICEKYYRPTLIITKSGDGYKGSGRSIEELNILKVIEEVSDLLEKYGGHAGACGFSLKKENLSGFIKKTKEITAKKLKGADLVPKLAIDAEVELEAIDENFIRDINIFAPFGQGNERPRFVSFNAVIVDIMNMGIDNQHIKLKIKNKNSNIISAIGFSQAEKWSGLRINDKIDIVYYAELNEYNGRREAQLKIIDIKG